MRTALMRMILISSLTIGFGAVARATSTADADTAAPTDIRIAWAGPAHTKIRITWDETEDAPNHVQVLSSDGTVAEDGRLYIEAGEPNVAQLDAFTLPGGRQQLRIGVALGTEPGGDTTPYGLSEEFDTLQPPVPVVDTLHGEPDDSVIVGWRPEPPADVNPGDPLDLAQATTGYQVKVITGETTAAETLGPATAATYWTVRPMAIPYRAWVATTPNEWGSTGSQVFYIDFETFGSLAFPGAVSYGQPTTIRGSLHHTRRACELFVCWVMGGSDAGRLVVLRARNSTVARWYVVGSVRIPPDQHRDADFRFDPASIGNRQFQVVVPETWERIYFARGVTSDPVTVLVRARIVSTRFLPPTVAYGQRTTASLRIEPAGPVRATLQRRIGSTWINVAWVPVRQGLGGYTFTALQRGTVGYRFYVPPYSWAGRTIAARFTATFTLTTR